MKDKTTALILSALLGGLGIDRFYLGYTGMGVLKLLTGGVFGVLWIIDIIYIANGKLHNFGRNNKPTVTSESCEERKKSDQLGYHKSATQIYNVVIGFYKQNAKLEFIAQNRRTPDTVSSGVRC